MYAIGPEMSFAKEGAHQEAYQATVDGDAFLCPVPSGPRPLQTL